MFGQFKIDSLEIKVAFWSFWGLFFYKFIPFIHLIDRKLFREYIHFSYELLIMNI